MKDSNDDKDEILLSFSDLVQMIKRNWRTLCRWSLVFALFGCFYALTKPIEYEAEATFKEKKKSSSGLGGFLNNSMGLLSDGAGDSDAITMMHSRKLVEKLIKRQGLQGRISKSDESIPLIPFQTMRDNLILELALFNNQPFPVLEDPQHDLKVTKVVYNKETPKGFRIVVKSDKTFDVIDGTGKSHGIGVFGKLFAGPGYKFILAKNTKDELDSEYALTLMPIQLVAKGVGAKLIVDNDKTDKGLVKIIHRNPDRKQAADNINTLMAIYQQYVQEEHDHLCKVQNDYLVQRQAEMANQLEAMMSTYAEGLSSDLSTTGFATSVKAMEFLAANQQVLKQKLFSLNLEMQRLENAQLDPNFDGELFISTGNFDIFNRISAERRQLKQLYDSLSLAIRGIQDNSVAFHDTFSSQLVEQDENQYLLNDTADMLLALEHNEVPNASNKLTQNPKFIVKEWHDRLVVAKEHFDNNASDMAAFEEWQHCKEGFSNYLSRLNHYLKVNQRNIEERLANQQIPGNSDYLGINLNIARELYMNYTKELCELESTANQRSFIIKQIDEPNFEISSLSTTLNDPISAEMIHRTSGIVLALRDHDNRSIKEQERLLADLSIQKGFLKTHLQQSITLLQLRQELLRKKIKEIQSINFSLVQEELSILENQLKDYLASALDNMSQEQSLLTQNLAELRIEMAAFPQKRTAEQLIEHQMDINKSLVEEISKLVESKNVSNNMEKFQSAPVDISIPPIHPKSPRLILLTVFGAFFGAFLSFVWMLGWSIVRGVKAIPETLQSASMHVSGTISRSYQDTIDKDPILDSDLNTMRHLLAYILPKSPSELHDKVLLLIEGKGPDYAKPVAELMSRKGLKVLIADMHFEGGAQNASPGILQFLEGKVATPAILHGERFDFLPSGGVCRYGNELIGSHRFNELMANLQKRYDWIIISSGAMPTSAEVEHLLELFPCAAITLQDETIQDLSGIIKRARKPDTHISFIFG